MVALKLCNIHGCDKIAVTKGYCHGHYRRLLRHGNPLAGGTYHGQPTKWLHDHKDFQGEDCLIWPFWRNPTGYAYICVGGRKLSAASVMCEIVNGKKPSSSHEVCHGCGKGNEACVHPNHVRWGTRSDNQKDRLIHGTDSRGEKHGQAFLTEDDVREIKSLRHHTKQKLIAEKFGISQSYVSAIQRGTRWSWVSERPSS